jgi:bifunctional non-homologous end joining protein LigD
VAGDPADALMEYRTRRRFDSTPEPKGKARRRRKGRLYTIQKHAARRLHYDLRLELDGVLKSWAVTRGPSLDPADKRLAVRTEDHPVEYATFEGVIPEGNYGAGTVLLWDRGTWEPIGDPREGLEQGKLVFRLDGERLTGRWALVRFRASRDAKRENWLLIKERDEAATADADVTGTHTKSVASGRDMAAVAAEPDAAWTGGAGRKPKKTAGRRAPRAGTSLPSFRPPALATLTDAPPEGKGWLFEIKFDGYRALAAADGDRVRIYTRNGLDWTRRYPSVAEALRSLDLRGALLDGEITVFDGKGRPDFGALQRALKGEGGRLAYFAFDLLEKGGKSLADRSLVERKRRLQALLGEAGRTGPVFYTDHVEGNGGEMHGALCDRGFEGVIAKRADAPYRSGRGKAWLKVKCARTQEFVIVGWSPSPRGRPFSSILLGQYEDGSLRYSGRVGTGFSHDELDMLARRFAGLARKSAPVEAPRAVARTARWVRPELVAQVAFTEFTRDGLVRQGRYQGLREDKPARAVGRERAQPLRKAVAAAAPAPKRVSDRARADAASLAGVTLTNPDRVLYPRQGVTKRDLAGYLARAADRTLPHVANRLLSLVRCPQGRGKDCFYQRHGGSGLPEPFRSLAVTGKGGAKRRYLYIEDAGGLIAAAQMGVLELHIWGSRIDRVDRPDRIVFDLDPDPAVGFETVKETAVRLRDVLGALELVSFPLLTGGKGIHVVAPVQRRHDWATVKAFARAVAERLVEDAPDRYVAKMTKARRKGRIFIDYFRNDRAATAIAPYSPRAREGAPVAWPVSWDRLSDVPAADWVRLDAAAERLGEPDPWQGYGALRQSLKTAALAALGL